MTIKTGDFVTTTLAHPNNVYEVITTGYDWLHLDDNTAMGLSVPTSTATLHEYCGEKWCRACHRSAYDGKTGDLVFFVRKTGEPFAETTAGKLDELKTLLDANGIDRDEILKNVEPTDGETIDALLFLARRIVKGIEVH